MNSNKSHQEIGRELDLFTFSDLVGSGLPLFTPKGTVLRKTLQNYIEDILEDAGYEFVSIPHIGRKKLYEVSGHLEKFSEDMFPAMESKGREYILKPSNCPHHIQIFARYPHSYREMPVRLAETTTQYRSEQSGELEGLTRVLGITLDDSHVFARPDQIKEEFRIALEINKKMLDDFKLDYWIRLSCWDPDNKNKYLGDEKHWEETQKLMEEILNELKIEYKKVLGEAAFYGPKMDLMIKDSLSKEWQLSTIQVDFNLPERFDLTYIDANGQKKRPIILHRATFGSYERFIAMIIEHFQGAFPVWLSPIQVAILPISDKHLDQAKKIADELRKKGVRTQVLNKSDTLQAKIREATLQKMPYLGIIGDSEIEERSISIRTREGEDQGKMDLSQFLKRVITEIEKKV
ncbi:MAG: threonine--tRNA ligase [Candidatus Levybacteria bacterium RIFCSPLOWO2_01_FULL_39_10]|nr:MAG: threonine--tRNA ligase [Candidatus Levybacteria bacterium RIFCSPLOWO2_01_FULL_39_10]